MANNWTRKELLLTLELYYRITYNRIKESDIEVIELAKILGRTPSAVKKKLFNFAHWDNHYIEKGRKGLAKGGRLTKEIWFEFFDKTYEIAIESNEIREKEFKETEKIITVKSRRGQSYFRQIILNTYSNRCAITGLAIPKLLIASHIKPWKEGKEERLTPTNGVCLNALHDKAFDRGLITITTDYKVKLSRELLAFRNDEIIRENFIQYENKLISLPDRANPSKDFLEFHNQNIFKG